MLEAATGVLTLTGNPTSGPPRENAELSEVRRAASGDGRAFQRLYQTHVARIHSLCRRMMGSGEADELTQDIFTRAWEKLGTYRGEAAFGTWLYRLALNLLIERRAALTKHRKRHLPDEEIFEVLPGRADPADSRIDFEAAIQLLPDGAREILVLHDVEGYKHEEIAGLLGINSGTSKSQLHRARMALRGYLER
jgi:RNA polymerase sigma-70 factor (ECF subfamily)